MTKPADDRTGMTLIEIMMSIMILGLGLLGILSVVPFIEYHSGRVIESDFVASVGTNAFGVITGNQWEKPANWTVQTGVNLYLPYNNVTSENYIFPRLLDPFLPLNSDNSDSPLDLSDLYIPKSSVYNTDAQAVSRVFPLNPWMTQTEAGMDRYRFFDSDIIDANGNPLTVTAEDKLRSLQQVFTGHDDVVYNAEENSQNRPEFLTEVNLNGATIPSYTGAYSWTALMTPVIGNSTDSCQNLTFPTVDSPAESHLSMRIDVMVFRGRDYLGGFDSLTANALQNGTGYAGGSFTLSAFDAAAQKEYEKNLSSATHLLLIGPDDSLYDTTTDGSGATVITGTKPYFSRWYRIAHYHYDSAGGVFNVSLIGESTPKCWNPNHVNNRSGDVRAVVFRNLRGVFTRTVPVTAPE